MMLPILATLAWHTSHPGAMIGLLELSGVVQPETSPLMNERKRETEARLRECYQGGTRKEIASHPVMTAYIRYYKRFNKTYHVLLQAESIAFKDKNLPDVCPLVDAAYISEMETFVLTAGHDVDRLQPPTLIDVSHEDEQMIQMDGTVKVIRAGDMIMRNAEGISCSILYGQCKHSPITAETAHVLYVAYAPSGVTKETVEAHLSGIEANIRLFSPNAVVEQISFLYG
jgi:DNA/RNA-binding domain of Phe-tRNA-synthetase-like protein